ncbi:MAG: zinc-ribbon domain-containing protein [Hyalangium sp.]|uniref:zinc-ribbon domain-containing protein n=1 Tax=Hyalangium sp. TaxID=2028555 RepID=UPI003899A6B8
MQIACPQCSIQYDLDPRLLPPAGASVQCTRCGLVFTATPSGSVFVPGQSPSPQPARPAVGTTTQVFGSPYAASKQGAPNLQTTQVFGAVPAPPSAAASPQGDDASERTPAFGSPTAGVPLAPGGKTQVFGAPSFPPQPPSASTTQVFGSAAVAAKAPMPTTTQVFGAVSAPPQPPSASTTQVFGAPPLPPQPPSASTTQVFGSAAVAAKAPMPTTTQVFGAVSIPSSPAAATTQTFGSAEIQAAQKAMQGAAPAPGKDLSAVPWLAEPGPVPTPARSQTGARPAPASPAPSLELPEEPVALPGPALPPLPPEPEVERSGPIAVPRRPPSLDLPPELVVPQRTGSAKPVPEPASGGGKERLLIILAAVVALGLTAWLSYPVWANRGSELPVEALAAKDEAVSLMRRDDSASRAQAITELNALVIQYPKFTEAQAELVVALALQLDDAKVELEWIRQEEARSQKEISQLELSKATADWAGRVNVRRQNLIRLGEQRRPLEVTAGNLTKQLEQAADVIRAAPETEPSADVAARLKAQAIYQGVSASAEAITLAERLRKVEPRPHWSVLTLAEYALNARSPPGALPEIVDALAQVRTQDPTFLRAYVLGARLALRQKDPATAQTLLDAVLALNPNHTLARTLQKWAASTEPAP